MDDFLELIYTSVVKGKLNNLPKSNKYNLKDNSNLKVINRIDNVMGNFMKFMIFFIIISLFLKFSIYSVILALMSYFSFTKLINVNLIKERFKNKSSDFKYKMNEVFKDNAKLKIKGLLIILILLNFSVYKKFYMMIFVALLVFTMNDIYSNIKIKDSKK